MQKKYGLLDFLRLPMRASPGAFALRIIAMAQDALRPSLQVILTAWFVDTALSAVAGQAKGADVVAPLLLLLAPTALRLIFWSLGEIVDTRMKNRLDETFRAQTLEKRARLAYHNIEDNEAWDLIGRVCKDPGQRVLDGFGNLVEMASLTIMIASVLALVAAQAWWAALVILAFSVPLFWVSIRAGQRQYEADKRAEKHERRAKYLSDTLTEREGEEERFAFGYTRAMNDRWREKHKSASEIRNREELRNFIRIKGTGLVSVLIGALIALVMAFPLRDGLITVGMFIGLSTAAFSLAQPLSWGLPYALSSLAKNREYLKDLTAFFALDEQEGATDAPRAAEPIREIVFDHVRFRYPGTERYVLDGFSMTLTAGRHYAFVGANGAGKTTVTKLLTGLYPEYEGEIRINGKELRSYPLSEVKGMFAVAFQDFARYGVSMRENIAIGDLSEGARVDAEAAVRALELTEAVEGLKKGLDTPLLKIAPDGEELSGGQWQRVALARVLSSRAQMRILDEPTAALDPMAESRVYELFGRVSEGVTTLFITHRLGAARLADEIAVIDGGRVAELGSHESLMARGGLYARMFESQRSWFQ